MVRTVMNVRHLALVTFSYVVAIVAAAGSIVLFPELTSPLAKVAVGDFVGTVVIFLFALVFRNSSFYDPYWSVAPVVIAFYWIFGFNGDANVIRQGLVAALITLYGARLTFNWARGWTGLDHEDWRYVDLRRQTGMLFPAVNFLGIMLFPTILVYLGCVPLVPALITGNAPVNLWDVAGCVVLLGGVIIEGVADNQLRRFVKERVDRASIMDRGLWSWSRHPNYFGEISVWFGVMFFGIASGDFEGWMISGAVAMVLLFVGVSIPMMEKRQLGSKPAYARYQKRTSFLIPLPPRRLKS